MPALPAHPPFNVAPGDFYVTAGAEMAVFETYTDVNLASGIGAHFSHVPAGDFLIQSGPSTSSDSAYVYLTVAVPDVFTAEFSASFVLPPDFTSIPTLHSFFGVVDQNGCCAGLFLSKVGISYTGSVRFNGLNLVLNSPLQLIPNSVGVIEEGKNYTVRIAVDSATQVAFIYITETSLLSTIGHQLRFIMPALVSADGLVPPVDEIVLSVCGNATLDIATQLTTMALGTGLIIPNLPPVAEAGRDQAVRAGTIVRFDGRASFDPEGVKVLYDWRLIDGPDSSFFVHPGHDGITTGMVMTDTFYSEFLGSLTGVDAPQVADVLLYEGTPYNIIGTGGSGPTFYVQIDGNYLPPGLTSANFKLLRQNALNDRTEAQPSFYPDVTGLFRFDLTVYDGDLHSEPSTSLVNVTDSPVPRGITPDVSFLWNYLSDFWKLVDNTEVIETFWGALAQLAASELLTLWQYDYNKSLRDVQRTFQRKWLHYDLFLRDPYPEETKTEHIYSTPLLNLPVAGLPLATGLTTAVFSSPLFDNFTAFIQAAGAALYPNEVVDQLKRQLDGLDKRFSVTTTPNSSGSELGILVSAPFPFMVTLPTSIGTFTFANGLPSGAGGLPVGVNTYHVDRSLFGTDVKDGDYLIVDGIAYRILRVVSDATDPWPLMRVIVKDSLPATVGKSWTIARGATSKFIDYYSSLCSAGDKAVLEVVNNVDQTVQFLYADVLSAAPDGSSKLLFDTFSISQFLARPDVYSVFVYAVYRRTYLPIESVVVGVPALQEKIKNTDDSAVLRQNIDYYVEEFRGHHCLRFVTGSPDVWQNDLPPQQMWAEVTYLDNNPNIEANFGIPASFTLDDLATLPSTTDYLSVVRGLWYAYFNGPTLFNLRAGTQILLGLPFAEVDGKIVEVRGDFTSSTGRILVQDLTEAAIVRSYQYPAILPLETNPDTGLPYAVGDKVRQFAPLVQGVEVIDYVKDPKWFEGYLNQGVFFEVEKFFKFLVRIDSAAFSLNTLVFVQSFIKRIKPTYTYPIYVVRKVLPPATVDVTDDVLQTVTLHLNEWIGQYSFDGTPPIGMVGGTFDDPHAAFGGWRRAFDSDAYVYGDTPLPAPTYPTAASPVHWGYDRDHLVPTDVITGLLSATYGAPFTVAYDGLFQMDVPTFDNVFAIFSGTYMNIPAVPPHTQPIKLGPPKAVGVGGTLNEALFISRGIYPFTGPTSVSIDLVVNNVVVQTLPLTIPAGYDYITPLPVTPLVLAGGDQIEIRIYTAGSDVPMPGGTRFFLALGHGSVWAFDTPLPAGTYYSPRLM